MAAPMNDGEGGYDPRFPDLAPEVFPRPFGNYLLLTRLAQGGMGEVFLAKHGSLAGIEKHCVVKTLRPHFTQDREYVTRFIDEARVVVGLAHRNIAPTFDVGRVGTQYYLAMEFIPGRDLRSIDDTWRDRYSRPLDEAIALHIVCEVLEALDYAHRAKNPVTGELLHLIHRDISPQNVMLSLEGEVKLIDFGLAQSTEKEEHTQPHVVMGKMAYMAPEQARGEPIDSSVDLFAVAIMAYELVIGERYYGEATLEQIWSVAGRGDYIAPRISELSAPLRKIITKGLHPERSERHKSCGDLREDLLNYMHERGMRAGSRELRTTMESIFGEDGDQHRAIIQRFADVRLADMAPAGPMLTPSGAHVAATSLMTPGSEESVSFLASQSNPAFHIPPQISGASGPAGAALMLGQRPGTESTGETARILKAPQMANKGKMAAIAASIVGALVVGVLALVLLTKDGDQQATVQPIVQAIPQPPAAGDDPNDPATDGNGADESAGDVAATADAGSPPAVADGTDGVVADGTDVVESAPAVTKPPRTIKRRPRTRTRSNGRLSSSLRSKVLKRPVDKLAFLRSHCIGRVSCARKHTNAVKKGPEALVRLIKSGQIDACLKQCRK